MTIHNDIYGKVMRVIQTDRTRELAAMLSGYDCPAILVSSDYRIIATNSFYVEAFGEIDLSADTSLCYRVSHGYDLPCDKAGEACPLSAATRSGRKERVLHIHQTPRGREHVDVEMIPITDAEGGLRYFVELLKPVHVAGAQAGPSAMVGVSSAFNQVLENVMRVGPTEASVLLLGESGTGKELAARAIHEASSRKDKPLVTLECAGLTETLFESELFGHVKGAFTGAGFNKKGLVAEADGGTLFLDEIGDVPLDLQVKLLRLIETGTYRQVGSNVSCRSDFRLICATHHKVIDLVNSGQFRQDLYYRINVFPVHLPSLSERRDDIPLLAQTLLQGLAPAGNHILTESALRCLEGHAFKGNIRELRNILARALVLANTHVIDGHVIETCLNLEKTVVSGSVPAAVANAAGTLKHQEKALLLRLIEEYNGDKTMAAKAAGVSLRTLYRKLAD